MTKQNKGRKLFAVSASAALVASAIVPVAASAAYSDESSIASWATDSVKYVTEKGFMQGDNGNFDPQGTFTRAQAAVVAAKVLGLDTTKEFEATFGDVKEGQWFFEEVSAAAEADIIKGSNGNFRPNDKLTRQEAAVILAKIYGLDVEAADVTVLDQFSDKGSIASYATKYLAALVEADIIKGSNGKLNPTGNIARQELAVMLSKADQAEVEVEVDPEELLADLEEALAAVETAVAALPAATEVTKENATDAQAKATAAQTAIDAAQAALDAVVEVEALTEEEVQEAQTAIDAAQAKVDAVKTAVAEATKPVVGLAVESVSAINASEIKVTFNQNVDEVTAANAANYQLRINNVDVTSNITHIDVTDNVATILLDTVNAAFQSGDKFVIQTKDSIKAENGSNAEKYVSEELTFDASAAPSLTKVEVKATGLQLTFDRPVDSSAASGDVTLIKIDGKAITATDLKPVDAQTGATEYLGKATKYVYNVVLTQAELEAASTSGKHDVVLYDVFETAEAYAKKASVLSGEYTVTNEVIAPEVTGVEALNANKFFVYTNTAVNLTAASKVVVTKGNHEFTNVDTTFDDALSVLDTKVDATVGFHPVNGKPGIFVVVTEESTTGDENPLYKAGETTATLNVTLENYTANGLVGKKSTQTVTLNKNNTKPAVKETNLDATNNKLQVTFTAGLAQLTGAALTTLTDADVVVRDKDGIIVPSAGSGIVVNGSLVEIEVAAAHINNGPFTVEFKADKFKNIETATSVASYLVNTVKNDKINTTVAAKDSNFKYAEFALTTSQSSEAAVAAARDYYVGDNVITFKYDVKMGDSARNVANYTIDGKPLPAGSTVDFVDDKTKVRISLPDNTFRDSTQYKIGISSNVQTESGSYIVGSLQTKDPVELVVTLKDNVKPKLKSANYLINVEEVVNTTSTKYIEVTFDENLAAALTLADADNDFKVVINGSTVAVADVLDTTTGDAKLVLQLAQSVNVNQAATISIIAEELQTGADQVIAIVDQATPANKADATVTTTASTSKFTTEASYVAQLNALASYTPVTFAKITSANAASFPTFTEVNAALPTAINVTLGNGKVVSVPLTWADTDTYDVTTPGSYTVTATWGTPPTGAVDTNSLPAPTVEVVVE